MTETRKLAAILAADVAGYSRLTAADEERTLARLRALRSDLVDPAISIHHGRVVKRTGDGILVEFRSPIEAVRCAIEVQDGMAERNAGLPPERRIEFRIGVHLGDVVEEADGDLMGDAVNIAARIEGIAAPGGIYVSRAAHEQIDGKITQRFTDLGDKELKNISKAVRVFALARNREFAIPAEQRGSAPPRLSIVVLPFANIGGNAEQEYFVDGVTESLTTDLSRISGSFVIARNTAFTFKGKPVDVKQIGRELNVRYVLEGSVQRGGNRLRVNVQLIDAETGAHLWAERFDKPRADLFDMQDEIVARLARQLDTELIAAEARRAARAPRPDSVDLYLQGTAAWHKGPTPENLARAHALFERALVLDPENVDALVGVALVDSLIGQELMAEDRPARLAAAEAAASRALELAPNHAFAHYVLGLAHGSRNRVAQGIAECEHALALDRNLAVAHFGIARAKIFDGRCDEAEPHIAEAIRLSPRDSQSFAFFFTAGSACFYRGRDAEALTWIDRAVEANRSYPMAHFYRGAILALTGRGPDAEAAVRAGMALDPSFAVRRFRDSASTDNPAYLAQRQRAIDGFINAGLPEE